MQNSGLTLEDLGAEHRGDAVQEGVRAAIALNGGLVRRLSNDDHIVQGVSIVLIPVKQPDSMD